MIARFNETGRSQVLAKRMPGDLSEYSVIQTKDPLDREGKVSRIVEFIEKPDQPQTLDSDIMAVGVMCFLPIFGLNWSVLNLEHGDVFS